MKIEVRRVDLLNSVKFINNANTCKVEMSVIDNYLFVVGYATANNDNVYYQIETSMQMTNSSDLIDKAITIDKKGFKMLFEVLKECDSDYITIENIDKLYVYDCNNNVNLAFELSNDVYTVETENKKIAVNDEFTNDLINCSVYTSKNSLRPILQCVSLNKEYMQATDSYQLLKVKMNNYIKDEINIPNFIIDVVKKSKQSIESISTFDNYNQSVSININENMKIKYSNKIGTFPNTSRLVPDECNYIKKAIFKNDEMLKVMNSLKRISKTLDGELHKNICTINFDDNNVSIKDDVNSYSKNLKLDINDIRKNEIDNIAFNFNYLINVLKQIDKDEKLTFNFVGKMSPFTIVNNIYTYLISPVRQY
jgi:hypothetical protein